MGWKIVTITLHYLGDVNCYLLKMDDGCCFLIDTGYPTKRAQLEKELLRSGCQPGSLKLILITHGDFDHTGNAAYLRDKFGAKVAMHSGDSGMAEFADMFWNRKSTNPLIKKLVPMLAGFTRSDRFTPDIPLEDGCDLSLYGLPARVFHLPGHSKGSVGFMLETGELFCGDLLENTRKPAINTIMDDPKAASVSFTKIRNLEIHQIYPGHGKPFTIEELATR